MSTIIIETRIRAPIELCFDLARDVNAHAESAAFSSERVVEPGRTQGLLEIGDIVAFEGRHFGITQRFVARITALDRPSRFVDEMVQGAFKRLRHVHEFEFTDGTTIMRDMLDSSGKLHWEFWAVWPICSSCVATCAGSLPRSKATSSASPKTVRTP